MRRSCQSVVVLTGLSLAACPALAGGTWVDFVDETATRMNPAIPVNDLLGKDDPEEKDYAWGDVDMDGDIDLIVSRKLIGSNSTGKINRLFMNEGGVLIDRTTEFATDATDGGQGFNDVTPDRDVALIDLDGDGWLDIVTASSGAYSGGPKTITHPRIYINLRNDGGGNWQGFRYQEPRIPTLSQTPNFCGVAFGDVDGLIASGGAPDLYFTDYENGLEDRILINDGIGIFSDETGTRFSGNTDFLDSTFAPHAVMADINDDGYNDIVKNSALGSDYNMWITYNDAGTPGMFTSGNTEIMYSGSDYFVAVADLNNDGMLDVVEVDDGSDRWFRNTGNGGDGKANFIEHTLPDTNGFGSNTLIADLDQDGFKDILIADIDVDLPSCTNNRLKILHNLGGPPVVTFVEDTANIPTTGGGPLEGTHDVAVFDINNDTWPDLVIGTCNGTTIWMNQPPFSLAFSYPLGLPAFAALDGSTEVQALLDAVGESLDPTSPTLHVSINGGSFTGIPMTEIGTNLYSANLPSTACLDAVSYYVSASLTGGAVFTDPPTAPTVTFSAVASNGSEILLLDEIEGDVSGWTITSDPTNTSGEWEQANPNFTICCGGQLAAPDTDATPSPGVLAFVTQNGPPGGDAADDDVDGGPTYLTSPLLDLAGTDAVISYQRWFFSDSVPNDRLSIQISNNGGGSWEPVGATTSTGSAWEADSFVVSDYVTPTANVQVRFFTSDIGNNSTTEAGIDDFQVDVIVCGPGCPTDITGDGTTNVLDLIDLLLCFGLPAVPGCEAEDVNEDGSVNVLDLIDLLLEFGLACP